MVRFNGLIPYAFFIFALALRLNDLSNISFWFDELWTATYWTSPHSLAAVWESLWMRVEGNLPFYPIFINLWSALFGNSELSLILPSALAGAVSVSVMYKLGTKLFSPIVGAIVAFFMATLSTPLYFSQEARCYSFILLFVSLNLLFRYSRNNIGWLITSLLLCWTHYFGIFFVFMQLVPDLIKKRDFLKWYVPPFLSVLVLSKLIYFQFLNGPHFNFESGPDFLSWIDWVLDSEFDHLTSILAAIFIIQSVVVIFSKQERKGVSGELVFFTYAPIVFLFCFSLLVRPIQNERYLITLVPPAILLVAQFLENYKPMAVILLVAGLGSALVTDIRQTEDYPRVKEALNFVAEKSKAGDVLYVPLSRQLVWQYYLKDFKAIKTVYAPHDLESYWIIDSSFFQVGHPDGVSAPAGYHMQRYMIGITRIYYVSKNKN